MDSFHKIELIDTLQNKGCKQLQFNYFWKSHALGDEETVNEGHEIRFVLEVDSTDSPAQARRYVQEKVSSALKTLVLKAYCQSYLCG